MQKFSTEVRDGDGNKVAESLTNSVNFGAGGDLALRFRANSTVDLQLTSGVIWIRNKSFDGIRTVASAWDGYMWNTGVSVIVKLNGKKYKDNMLYAPSKSYVRSLAMMSMANIKRSKRWKNAIPPRVPRSTN